MDSMGRRICMLGATFAVGLTGIALAGCGSSSSGGSSAASAQHTTTLPSGQLIIEAADHTDRAPGYRVNATIVVDADQTKVTGKMSGTIQRRGGRGALSLTEQVDGKTVHLQFRTSGETFYMSGVPGLSTLGQGRKWVSFNLDAAQQADGLGGLQTETSSDPAKYLAYLRGISGEIQSLGMATIRGVATTHYHATVDLDRYAARAPAADRAAARKSIATLETELGGHTLPVDVWIDAQHRVRQMQLQFPLCADGQSASLSMTMDLSNYGQVPAVTIPPASDTHDITSQLKSLLSQSSQTSSSACSSSS
jgi:hypothetical protein